MKRSSPTVTIIGTGAVGSALADFFTTNGYFILSVWNSRFGIVFGEDGTEKRIERTIPKHDTEIADLIFVTTPDDLISKISGRLSGLPIHWPQRTVVHCSGNLSSEEFSVLSDKGASTASLHPIQTFKNGDGAERFGGISMSVEGDKKAAGFLIPMIQEMGANPIRLSPEQKRTLHIAAVFASNNVVALLHQTEKLLKEAGLHDGLKIVEPLTHQSIKNIFEQGTVASLTGPVARGDVKSIQKHLEKLGNDQLSRQMYLTLGAAAINIAEKRGNLTEGKMSELKRLLKIGA